MFQAGGFAKVVSDTAAQSRNVTRTLLLIEANQSAMPQKRKHSVSILHMSQSGASADFLRKTLNIRKPSSALRSTWNANPWLRMWPVQRETSIARAAA
ncbi:hypothetical protein ACVWZW_008376 [Bradyrhizobium sp. F1.13.4]